MALIAVVMSGLYSLCLATPALASTQTINVQGKVTNTDGTNVTDGVYDFVFKLYDGAGAGASTTFTENWLVGSLFSSTMSSAPASGGTSVTYSSNTNELSLAAGQTLWNTIKGEAVTIVAVNTSTNVVTISPTRQAWNTSDTITNRIYVKDGVFQVSLNSLNQNWGTTTFSNDLYLGITFNNDGEMKPRSQFSSVPYSFRADSAASVDGLSVVGGKTLTVSNSLTLAGTDGRTLNIGGNNITFTTSAATSLTLPSSGTLATLAGAEVLTNKTITTSGLLTAGAGFTLSGGALSLPAGSVTDAMVSNTLTSSIFIGSGSTTNAIDLGTAEVAGTLSIARGGTNSTATPTAGGLAYGTGTAFAFTAAGSSGQCLQSNGATAPTWGACFDIGANSLNFTELADALALDASTSIALGTNALSTSGTGGIAFGHTGATTFAGPLTSSGLVTAAAGLAVSGGALSLPNDAVTDAMVSDTLTSSVFIGSGSETDAVDLGSAEVAGVLKSSALWGSYGNPVQFNAGITIGAWPNTIVIGSGLTYNGNSRPTKTISLQPNYPGSAFTTNNGSSVDISVTGNMLTDIESSSTNKLRTFYEWNSDQSSLNYYTVAVRIRLPKDFSAWTPTNAVEIDYATASTSPANNVIDARLYLESNSSTPIAAATANSSASAGAWTTATFDDSVLDDGSAPEWDAADENAVLYLRMGSNNGNYARIGEIRLNYLASF